MHKRYGRQRLVDDLSNSGGTHFQGSKSWCARGSEFETVRPVAGSTVWPDLFSRLNALVLSRLNALVPRVQMFDSCFIAIRIQRLASQISLEVQAF